MPFLAAEVAIASSRRIRSFALKFRQLSEVPAKNSTAGLQTNEFMEKSQFRRRRTTQNCEDPSVSSARERLWREKAKN
jgi:hypothetical protein